jgi:hypothetical protein
MSSDQKPSPFVELADHKEFSRFGQSSLSNGTSYAPEWEKNYFVIAKNSWFNDENGQPKQKKTGVYLTIPAARAFLPVLKSAIESAKSFECQHVASKRKAQPKPAIDTNIHVADYLNQSGMRFKGFYGGRAGETPNVVGPSAERDGAAERGSACENQFGGYSDASTAVTFASTCASAAVASSSSQPNGKQVKPRGPRKQQTAKKGGAAVDHPGRRCKIRKEVGEECDKHASTGDDGNNSDTIMQ